MGATRGYSHWSPVGTGSNSRERSQKGPGRGPGLQTPCEINGNSLPTPSFSQISNSSQLPLARGKLQLSLLSQITSVNSHHIVWVNSQELWVRNPNDDESVPSQELKSSAL